MPRCSGRRRVERFANLSLDQYVAASVYWASATTGVELRCVPRVWQMIFHFDLFRLTHAFNH
jgi:hypothetical protein